MSESPVPMPTPLSEPAGPAPDRKDSGLRLTSQTWEGLLRAEVSLMRAFEAAGDFDPLSKTEYDVLFILAVAPDRRLRLRDLNEQVLMAQPSLSRMADRLTAAGYVASASPTTPAAPTWSSPTPGSPSSGRSPGGTSAPSTASCPSSPTMSCASCAG